MTFPTIPTVANDRIAGVNQPNTTATLTGPNLGDLSGKAAGDLVIAIAGEYQSNAGADAAFTGWAGGGLTWTEIRDSTGTAVGRLGVAYARLVTGTETGAVTVTRSGTLVGDASMILMCIPGAHASTAPEASVMATGNPADVASFNPAGWDVEDTLWIGVNGNGLTNATGSWTGIDAAPTNYTDLFDMNPTDTSTVGDFGLAVAFRQNAAASEDMGAFGQDTSNARSSALIIAVRPAAVLSVLAPVVAAPSTVLAPTNVYKKNSYVNWRTGDDARFTPWTLTDPGTGAATDITDVNPSAKIGRWESTAGSGVASDNRREFYVLNDVGPWNGGHSLALLGPQSWIGPSPDGTVLPQHGMVLRAQQAGGRNVAIIAWQNITFGFYWTLNLGVWGSNTDGTDFLNRQINLGLESLIHNTAISAYVRTSNIVTITASGHNCQVGDYIGVDMADDALDMAAIVTGVTGTTVTYTHTGSDVTTGGTGTLRRIFPYWLETRMASNSSTETVLQARAWRRENPTRPAWVDLDVDAGLDFPGGNGNYVSAPDAADFDLTSDFDIRVDLTTDDWTPAADQILVGKYLTTGNQRSYAVRIRATTGAIELLWAATGTNPNGAISTVAPTISDGQRLAIRVVHDNDNGVGSQATTRFYTAPTIDGPWTQLGSDVSTNWLSGAGGVFNGTAPLEIGAFNGGTNAFAGTIHNWEIRNASDTVVSEFIGQKIFNGATSFGDSTGSGNTFTLNGTVAQVNTGLVGGSSAAAFAVDVHKAGTPANRADTPTPTGPGYPGVVVAHLGTSDFSRVTYGQYLAHESSDSEFILLPVVAAPSTALAPTVSGVSATNITPGVVAAPSTVLAPQVNLRLAVPVVAAPSTVLAPQVNLRLAVPVVAASSAVLTPAAFSVVQPGVVSAPSNALAPQLNLRLSMPLVEAPSIPLVPSTGGATQVQPGVVAAPSTTLAPQVNLRLSMPVVVAPSTALAPTGRVTVSPGVVAAPSTVLSPRVNFRLSMPVVAAPSTTLAPAIPKLINAPVVAGPTTVLAPQLNLRLLFPLVAAGSTVHEPLLSTGGNTGPGIPVEFAVQDHSVAFVSPSGAVTVVESSRAFVAAEPSTAVSVTEALPSAVFAQADGKVEVTGTNTQWEIEET